MRPSAPGIYVTALIAGIVAGDAWTLLSAAGLLGAPVLLLSAICLRRRKRTALLLLALGCLLAGVALPARWTRPPPPSDLDRVLCSACGERRRVTLTGLITGPPLSGPAGTRFMLAVAEVERDGCRRAARGNTLVYVGEETPALRAGDRLRLRARVRPPRRYRNPGSPDRPRALARKGIRRIASVARADEIVLLGSRTGSRTMIARVRRRMAGALRREAPREAPVLEALLLGDRNRIPPPVREAFARAGTAHILAVSGLHIAMVALMTGSLLIGLLGRSVRLLSDGAARRFGIIGGTVAAWVYALIAGGAEPALRAALMGTAIAAAAIAGRRGNGWNGLLLAGAFLVLLDPARVFDPGVQLSFASVAGLLWCWGGGARRTKADGSPRGRHGDPRAPLLVAAARRVGTLFLITISATMATLPIQASLFGRVSLAAPLGNLVVVPLLGSVAVPCLLLSGALLTLSERAAGLLIRIAAAASRGAVAWVRWLSGWDGAAVAVPPPSALETLIWLALFLALPPLIRRRPAGFLTRRRAMGLAALGLVALAGDAALWTWRLRPPPSLRIRVLDVGQGDATLIETPEGERILVDAGPAFSLPGGRRFDAGERVVAPALRALRIRTLDVLVVTHPDADHAGGVPAILESFRVGEVWIPAGGEEAEGIRPVITIAGRLGVPVVPLARGVAARVRGNTRIEILGPPGPFRHPPASRRGLGWNDRSLVLRIVTPDLRVLLTGDIEAAGEAALLSGGRNLRSEILKVPHHGSDTSSSRLFLAAVRPRLAIISAGRGNRFGFPGAAALERLTAAGARVLRTDLHGAITVSGAGGRRGSGPIPVTRPGIENSFNRQGERAVKEGDQVSCFSEG